MDVNEIKFEALKELGYTEEPDFDDDADNGVNAMNTSYSRQYHLALTSYDWSFAKKAQNLTRYSAVGRYKYSYDLPRDLLYIRGIYSDSGFQQNIEFYERNGDTIYTDSPAMYIVYTAEINEQELPAYFTEYFIYMLARKNCTKITGDRDLLQELMGSEQTAYSVAKNTDIKQQEVRVFPTGAFVDVRN